MFDDSERKAELKEEREGELSDIRNAVGSVEGRRFLYRILEQCGVMRSVLAEKELIYYCLLYTSPSPRD